MERDWPGARELGLFVQREWPRGLRRGGYIEGLKLRPAMDSDGGTLSLLFILGYYVLGIFESWKEIMEILASVREQALTTDDVSRKHIIDQLNQLARDLETPQDCMQRLLYQACYNTVKMIELGADGCSRLFCQLCAPAATWDCLTMWPTARRRFPAPTWRKSRAPRRCS